jgi:hypothetical protein
MDIKSITKPDGSLHAISEPAYIDWTIGDERITLDGELTIKELEWIVAHIKSTQGQTEKTCIHCGQIKMEHEDTPHAFVSVGRAECQEKLL